MNEQIATSLLNEREERKKTKSNNTDKSAMEQNFTLPTLLYYSTHDSLIAYLNIHLSCF